MSVQGYGFGQSETDAIVKAFVARGPITPDQILGYSITRAAQESVLVLTLIFDDERAPASLIEHMEAENATAPEMPDEMTRIMPTLPREDDGGADCPVFDAASQETLAEDVKPAWRARFDARFSTDPDNPRVMELADSGNHPLDAWIVTGRFTNSPTERWIVQALADGGVSGGVTKDEVGQAFREHGAPLADFDDAWIRVTWSPGPWADTVTRVVDLITPDGPARYVAAYE